MRTWVLVFTAIFSIAAFTLPLDKLHEKAPDFAFQTKGKVRRLSDYKGHDLIVHFWASWCLPCKREIPELLKLKTRLGKSGPEILFVSADKKSEKADAERFLKDFKPSVELNLLVTTSQSKKYIGWGLPVTYFINAKQFVVARRIGPIEWSKIKSSDLISTFGKN